MKRDEAVLIGYFPKKTSREVSWLNNPSVKEICSVCDCMSKGPPDWIDQWKHNTTWWLFDDEDAALSVIKKERELYDLYAYKLFPARFDGLAEEIIIVEDRILTELGNYNFLGYDIVTGSDTRAGADPTPSIQFGCSPLSCNNACENFSVNNCCLIDKFEDALTCCKKIAAGGKWEPGPYYLVEVYRKKGQ